MFKNLFKKKVTKTEKPYIHTLDEIENDTSLLKDKSYIYDFIYDNRENSKALYGLMSYYRTTPIPSLMNFSKCEYMKDTNLSFYRYKFNIPDDVIYEVCTKLCNDYHILNNFKDHIDSKLFFRIFKYYYNKNLASSYKINKRLIDLDLCLLLILNLSISFVNYINDLELDSEKIEVVKVTLSLINEDNYMTIVNDNIMTVIDVLDPVIKIMNKDVLKDIVLNNPILFELFYNEDFIKDLSIENDIVCKNGLLLNRIQNQNEQMCLNAIYQNINAIKCVKNPTVEMVQYILNNAPNPNILLDNPKCCTESIYKALIRRDYTVLQHIQQNDNICIYAIECNPKSVKYIKIEAQTDIVCETAVRYDGMNLKYIINQTNKIINLAIQQNPEAKKYIIE